MELPPVLGWFLYRLKVFYLWDCACSAIKTLVLVLLVLVRREFMLLKSANQIQADRDEGNQIWPSADEQIHGRASSLCKVCGREMAEQLDCSHLGPHQAFTRFLLISGSIAQEGKPGYWSGLQGIGVILLVTARHLSSSATATAFNKQSWGAPYSCSHHTHDLLQEAQARKMLRLLLSSKHVINTRNFTGLICAWLQTYVNYYPVGSAPFKIKP